VTRWISFAIGFSLVSAGMAEAQIIDGSRPISREPAAWTSLSIGWLTQQDLCDQDSNACWNFGGAPQWRATLDYPVGRGASLGVAATRAKVPLTYEGSVLSPNSCAGCDADANITQYFANFHMGGGESGVHQVIDINAGMTVFSNFRSTSGTRLGGKAVSDFSFAIGYGLGYGFSPRMQLMLVQDYGLIIHKRAAGSSQNTAQQSTTRVGLRVGLGEKRRRY
jgi:hypothetical protein